MDFKEQIRRLPLGILVGLATLMVASGGSVAWFTWRALNPKPPVANFPTLEAKPETVVPAPPEIAPAPPIAPEAPAKEPTDPAAAAEITGQIFWLKDEGNGLKLVPEPIALAAGTKPNDQVKAAFAALLSQPTDGEQNRFTTIPAQTKLLDATVAADGIHVDLSADFQTGGGSASMMGRLGQVIYTATAFNPDAPVWISVEGKPLTLLGGEGLEVSQPMTRTDFDQGFQL